jgi:hypothetical protein
MTLGEVLAKSGFFNDSRQAAQCVAKILAGRELGFGPIASMTGVYIVKGRITLSANLIGAAIKRSARYNYKIDRMDNTGCVIGFYEDGQLIGTSEFTEADAKAAGLLAGENWKKYPRNMYFARAMSNGARWYCPDVFNGPVYTPDEMGQMVDGDTGDAVRQKAEVISIVPEQPQPVIEPEQQAAQPPKVMHRETMFAEIRSTISRLSALAHPTFVRSDVQGDQAARILAHLQETAERLEFDCDAKMLESGHELTDEELQRYGLELEGELERWKTMIKQDKVF